MTQSLPRRRTPSVAPGLNAQRLLRLMRDAVARCQLDLHDLVVLTEAATGAYIVTPILAAMAGARRVYAVTRDTRYGTFDEVVASTLRLASAAGVAQRIQCLPAMTPQVISEADIVTNSGHVRPINRAVIQHMKPTAVIPLMYERWEFRDSDVDLAACQERGIRCAGTNERITQVGVFDYLGVMAVKLLLDAGIAVYGTRVLLLCDNPFGPFIERGLRGAGATVEVRSSFSVGSDEPDVDVILVALRPTGRVLMGAPAALLIAHRWPGAVVAQFWGDIDRTALGVANIRVWPAQGPAPGHMAILPSAVGPEPIVRLQAGGLKTGEVLSREARSGVRREWEYVDEG